MVRGVVGLLSRLNVGGCRVRCAARRLGESPGSREAKQEHGSAEPKAERDASPFVTLFACANIAPKVARPLALSFGNALGPG